MKINLEDWQKVKKLFRSPAMAQVVRWSQCVYSRVIWICVLRVVLVCLSLLTTLVTKDLVDAAVSAKEAILWKSGLLLLVVMIAQIVLGWITSMVSLRASTKLQRSLQGTLIRDILTKEYSTLKSYHSGELVNRVFSDAGVIKGGVMGILPSIIGTLVSFIGAAAILIALDWRFVLLLACAGLVGTVIVLCFRKPMKERHLRMQKAEDKLHASIQETLENIRLIKASLSEKRVFRQIDSRQETMEKEQVRQGKFHILMNNSMGMMFSFSWLFCMLWGCAAIFRGELTYGSLAAMIQLIGRVQGPIASAVSIAGEIYRVIASAERLMELTDLPSETMGEPLKDFDEINIDHVTFRYEDGTDDVLRDISCTMVYRTGPAETPASRETRALFSYVPQGNTLFSGTLRENLTMFTDEATDAEIAEAVRAACIDDLAEEIGLDAELGERGVGISEGQAQRVAVARALLTKAPILLLDESTSALDEETEARMLQNISAMRDKTCLIVTHRKAALAICDYRLHITEGRMTKRAALPDKEEPCTTTESRK